MKLFIDADACPVTGLAVCIAKEWGIQTLLVSDHHHRQNHEGVETILVMKGADSADFRLVNLLSSGDVVVTQDYGLAAMCLSKGTRVLNQNGMEYGEHNIDGLLWQRHEARKIRRGGGRTKGPSKRTAEQDLDFEETLRRLLAEQSVQNS